MQEIDIPGKSQIKWTEPARFAQLFGINYSVSKIVYKSFNYKIVREYGRDHNGPYNKTIPAENSKKQSVNSKMPPNTKIAQRSLIDLGRSVGVTGSQLVWLNRFTGSQPSD